MKYIDVHSHIHFPEFDADRDDVVLRAKEAGVGMILVGTDLESSKKAIEVVEKYKQTWPYMWAIVGLHPNEPFVFDHAEFTKLAQHKSVVAIGECGLDYFRTKTEDLQLQRNNFVAQIHLANEVGKPLMLHIRNGGANMVNGVSLTQSAYADAAALLKEHSKVHADFHFFAGNTDDVRAGQEIGAHFSFTGVLTFTKDYDEVVDMISLKHVMSETDCPFVAPAPYRGKRNESAYVVEVVKAIARIKNEPEEKVREQLLENAKKFFKF